MVKIPRNFRYLALGDSYTHGEGVRADERWPAQLATALARGAINLAEVRVIARTGWTTQELAEGMALEPLQPGYDLVSLQIGVNNQYRGQSLDSYRSSFRALLARALILANDQARHVLVISIPDWSQTSFARDQGRDSIQVARELDGYNAVARDEAAHAGTSWVDITPTSRRPTTAWIGLDGLHPTAAQYAAWVEVILPAARAALS